MEINETCTEDVLQLDVYFYKKKFLVFDSKFLKTGHLAPYLVISEANFNCAM